ncbi:box-containing protein, partial [Moniliophthora roreri]
MKTRMMCNDNTYELNCPFLYKKSVARMPTAFPPSETVTLFLLRGCLTAPFETLYITP